MGADPCPALLTARASGLPFRLAACQLFHLALFRSARVIAGLLRLFRLALLAGGAFALLTFFFGEFLCVCHDCVWFPLLSKFRTGASLQRCHTFSKSKANFSGRVS